MQAALARAEARPRQPDGAQPAGGRCRPHSARPIVWGRVLLCLFLVAGLGQEAVAQSARRAPKESTDSRKDDDTSTLPQCAPGQADPDHTGCRPVEWIMRDRAMQGDDTDESGDTGAGDVAPDSAQSPDSGGDSRSDQ